MAKTQRCIITVVCVCIATLIIRAPAFGYGDKVLVLEEGTERYALVDHLDLMQNPEGDITLENILERPSEHIFIPANKAAPDIEKTNIHYWFRFSAINNTHLHEWILDHRFANIHHLDLYMVNAKNEIVLSKKSGNLKPFSQRDIPHRRILFDLALPKGEAFTFFLSYKSDAAINTNIELVHKSYFIVKDHKESTVYGIFYGFIILFLVTTLVLTLLHKKIEHAYSFGFILFIGITLSFFDGHAQTLIDNNHAGVSIYGLQISFDIAIIFLILYWKETLLIEKRKIFHFYCIGLSILWAIQAFLSLVLPYRESILLLINTFILTTPFLFYLGIVNWRSKNIQAKLLLFSLPVFYFGTITGIAYSRNMLPIYGVFEYAIQIGVILFIISVVISSILKFRIVQISHDQRGLALDMTEARLRAFLDHSLSFSVIMGPDGTLLEANRAALDFEGATLEQLLHKPLWEVSRFSHISENKIKLQNAIKAAQAGKSNRIEIQSPDKNEFLLEVSLWPYYNEHHTLSYIVAEGRDITELVQSHRKIRDIAFTVSEKVGDKFFEQLVIQLAKLIDVKCVLIGSASQDLPEKIDVIAQNLEGKLEKGGAYGIEGSPFKHILKKQPRLENCYLRVKYPKFDIFHSFNGESYLGIPLVSSKNTLIGLLAVFDDKPLDNLADINEILQIFISRAETELERKLADIEVEKYKEKLYLHTQNTPLAVIELDTQLRITNWNPSATLTFGFEKHEAMGQQAIELLTRTENANYDDVWLSMMSNRNGHFSRISNTTKNGNDIVCDWYNTLLIDDKGEMFGVAALIVNVNAEQKAVNALKEKENEQHEILDFMVDAVITINDEGVVSTCNKAACSLFGFGETEIIGKNVSMLMPSDTAIHHNGYLKHFTDTGEAQIIGVGREVTAMKKDGTLFPIRLSVAELPPNGTQRRFIGSCQDLTSIKQQEEQLRRSQKMDALGKLTGGIAHDFNNLLGVVMGYADLLKSMLYDQPKLEKYSDEIHRACERGANLTKKLLSFSRQQLPDAKPTNINTVVEEGRGMLERVLTSQIHVQYFLAKDLHSVFLDRGDLEDAILNLSINAMHAMDTQGDLIIRTENISLDNKTAPTLGLRSGSYVALSVADTGHGMDEETKAKIFDPFFSTKGDGGTGLGLSQVYGFVERSGGKIHVDSKIGDGTILTMHFPRYERHEDLGPTTTRDNPRTFVGDESILLVDDELALLSVSEQILVQQGYDVKTAENGEQALSILASEHVDMMISDVIMPNMDGYELASIVSEKYPTIKILLASGYTKNRQLNEKYEQMNFPLLRKPYNPADLLQQIRTLING
ncbi:MAG: PAS domain S-box protein [Agarilytica sp.]